MMRKDRLPDTHKKLAAEYDDWNAAVLPEDSGANSGTFYGNQLAGHYGNKPE